jgi:NADH-quinone oxidoreductase subunit K/multicomponent Na+:H+ antiporter subunit C
MNPQLLHFYVTAIVLVAVAGLYYLLVTTSLIRAIIGLELVTKSITVGLILAGKLTGKIGVAQSLAITLIVVEVVVMVVAVGLILAGYRHTDGVDVRDLRNIKG